MLLLILSLIPLWFGPLLFSKINRKSPWISFLDGFVFVSLIGLILFSIIPESFAGGNGWAVLFFFGGMWLPVLLEDVFKVKETSTHLASFIYVGFGLFLHATIDGAMLVETPDFSEHHPGEMLSLAVIFHRIPVGFGLWWLVRPHFGNRLVLWLLASMTAGTLLGFYGWHEIETLIPHELNQAFQAIVAGSLLHIIFHNTFQHSHVDHCHHDHEAPEFHPLEMVGNILGIAVLIGAVAGHDLVHEHHAHEAEEMNFGEMVFLLIGWTAPLLYTVFLVMKKILNVQSSNLKVALSRFSAFHLFLLILSSWAIGIFGESAHGVLHFLEELQTMPIWGTVMMVLSALLSALYLYFLLVKGARSYVRQFF